MRIVLAVVVVLVLSFGIMQAQDVVPTIKTLCAKPAPAVARPPTSSK